MKGKRPVHRSIDWHRVEADEKWDQNGRPYGGKRPKDAVYPTLEVAFAREWEKENERNPGINQGFGVLQNLMIEPRADRLTDRVRYVLTQRDAAITATAIQWLGTNVGRAWLSSTLRLAGYAMLDPGEVEYRERRDRRALAEEQAESWLERQGFRWKGVDVEDDDDA